MTISYSLGPNPKWYIADLVGKPLGGGYMATFSSLDQTVLFPVYQDPAGQFTWPYVTIPNVGSLGILFDENGAQGPFYWQFDTANPDELYYIEVYDSNGVLQWTIDNYMPSGSGGGGVVTEAYNLVNLIQNNSFYRNIGTSTSPLPTNLTLAPSAHAGLCQTSLQTFSAGPDVQFLKNNTSATDQIIFTPFTLGSNPLTGDVTPVSYLKYKCTNSPSAETTKCIQIPITSNVQNLNNQTVIASFWARFDSGTNPQISIAIRQFFGDGAGASSDVVTVLQMFTLSNTWTKYSVTGAIPSIASQTIGPCGNDGVFFQLQLPLNQACEVDMTLPSLYIGEILPNNGYVTNDMIEVLDNSPRTGDIRQSLNTFYPYGWVPLNDGTIGSNSSNATTRANLDTFPLYNLVWNAMSSLQTIAPMYNSAGAVVSYGSSSVADYTANNALSLTKQLNRVLAGVSPLIFTSQNFTADHTSGILTMTNTEGMSTGVPVFLSNTGGALPAGLTGNPTIYYAINVSATTLQLASSAANAFAATAVTFTDNGSGTNSIVPFNTAVGNIVGDINTTLALNQLPAHTHDITTYNRNDSPSNEVAGTSFGAHSSGSTVTGPITGGSTNNLPISLYQPTTYMNFYMKL